MDYGLIGGIGQGIQQGLLMYQKQKQLNRENQIQNLTSGLETDEDGNLKLNPQAQLHKDATAATDQGLIDRNNPNSQLSQTSNQFIKGTLPSNMNIPDNMSAEQIKELSTYAKPVVNNNFAMQKQDANNDFKADQNDQNRANQLNIANKRIGATNGRLGQGDERIHNNNLAALNKDPTLTGLATTKNNLQNAVTLYQKGGATPQEFQELQQSVRSNLGIKGTSGVNERADTYLTDLGLKADEKKQFLFGDLQSVMQNHPQLSDQILKMANLEIQNKQKQYQDQVAKLKAGHASFYNAHPDLGRDYDNTVTAGNQMMTPEAGQGGGILQGGAGSFGQDVLNYAKTHGISAQQAQVIKDSRTNK